MEPEITINGTNLTTAQALTLRMAVEVFMSDLNNNSMGDDDHAKAMTKNYKARLQEIRRIMLNE